ncbi:hypothetical protein NDU88_010651 [Pleurodeles waltl]|uniref:Uncharacterized protein n=1 Tax=Pleurodeles waltl TaxID=8319 RepID=A0AAV7QXZ0_PLEWA|nr:hypothetical protein NDU88_010651 [Pleurodeles waltl]
MHTRCPGLGEVAYLVFDSAVAADGPHVLECPPDQDDEEPPEEGDHGRGEEGPPHALALAVTGHLHVHRDDQGIHLVGHEEGGRVRAQVVVVYVVVVTHGQGAANPYRSVALCHG